MRPVGSRERRRRLVLLLALLAAALAVLLATRAARRPASSAAEPVERTTGSLAALGSLGYLARVDATATLDKRGVTRLDASRSAPGANLFSSLDAPTALLVDRDGETLHRWSLAVGPADRWQHVEPLPDGGLLALVEETRLVALDRESRLGWTLAAPVHHDVARLPDGGFYVLVHQPDEVERKGGRVPVLADSILRLDAAGEMVGRLDLLPVFVDAVSETRWQAVDAWLADFAEPVERLGPRVALKSGSPADLFHANSVEILPRDVPPIGKAGDLLLSLRELDTIAVVDFDSGDLRWSWGPGVLRRQHDATLLDDDHLLVFDNRGGAGGRSRVVEVDPETGGIVWSYEGDPPASFFSALRGAAQRLANGNTLITESDTGRAFEVTPAGEVVWEFYDPLIDERDRTRPAIYRMRRFAPGELPWLE
jgi:hypothetical protein